MEVVVDDVEAHVAGAGAPDDRVQVRPVVVEERAAVVEDPRDLLDPLVEQPEGRGVRQHQARRPVVDLRAEVLEVQVAAVGRRDLAELESGHGDTRRVRAVRRVRRDDHVPPGLAAIGEHRAHEHQPRELALRARRGLQRDGREPRDLGEDLLQLPHQLERALRTLVLLERVEIAEPGEGHDAFVDSGVVLHRARAERVEAGVDPEVAVGERREVPHDLVLRHLGQPRRRLSPELRGDLRHRQVVGGDTTRAPPRPRLLVDQLHQRATSASTSARRSTSPGVRFSVSATRRTSSRPG